MRASAFSFILLAASFAGGCEFHARSADDYRKETRALLETKNPDIRTCYDAELQKDAKAGGTVIITFKVQKETGQIVEAKVDEVKSSAPATLGQCVVQAINGLTLDPPDEREGDATFQWEFQAPATLPAPAAKLEA